MFNDLKNLPKNIDSIKNGVKYTYGVDPQGKMYIYDTNNNKMVFYGDQRKGADQLVTLHAGGGRTVFEGDRSGSATTNNNNNVNRVVGGGGGANSAPKLDQAGLASIDSQMASYDTDRANAIQKAALKRDSNLRIKEEEREREKGKWQGKKLETLQDFGETLKDSDLNTRDTLENLISSMSTLGLGGRESLQRQVLSAANIANRKANATQAKDTRALDDAYNEFSAANENDMRKIRDQFGYDEGEANKAYHQSRQNALFKKGDIYGAANDAGARSGLYDEANNLNSLISNSAFLNPSYTGESRQMATPGVSDYSQDIAQYDTSTIGNPLGEGGQGGNLAIKAITVNDKDLGIKKKTENELGYGV